MHITIQECNVVGGRGGVPCEVDRIANVGPFEEVGEGIRTMGPKKYLVNEPQLKVGFIKLGIKEFLHKMVHEKVSIGGSHTGSIKFFTEKQDL